MVACAFPPMAKRVRGHPAVDLAAVARVVAAAAAGRSRAGRRLYPDAAGGSVATRPKVRRSTRFEWRESPFINRQSIAPARCCTILSAPTVPRARIDAVIADSRRGVLDRRLHSHRVRGAIPRSTTLVFVLRRDRRPKSAGQADGDIGPAGTLAYEFSEHMTWIEPVTMPISSVTCC